MTKTNSNLAFNRKNILWVYLSGAMALTIIVMLFLPSSGMGGAIASVYSVMLWCGIFGTALSRYLDRNGWLGFAIGSGVGLALQILSQLVV